jgi:diketogulonate reductase-like aldo/keto reductase
MHTLWERMESLVDMDLAKGVGVSNFNTQLLADILTYARRLPIVNQVCLNPVCAQADLVKFLIDHEIAPIAYSPLGRLGSKKGPTTENLTELPLIKELAAKYSVSETQLILNWGLSRGYTVIPKATSLEHQTSNFAALDFSLDPTDVKAITGLD